MLWGLRPLEDKPDQFFATISSLISNGVEITHILSFNEPEMPQNVGGSDISPVSAATIFKSQILRLQSEKSLKIGAPSVSGSPEGLNWLREFFKECGDDCKPDFLPIHWYGNFLGLKQHVENVRELYPELDIWVTEFAYPNVGLNETQQFYNESVSFFEETE